MYQVGAQNTKLRKARTRRFWTIEVASQKAQVSPVTYLRWEQGQQKPHPASLEMLCNAFEMSPGELGFAEVQEIINESTQVASLFDIGILALMVAQRDCCWSSDELERYIKEAIRSFAINAQSQNGEFPRRRVLTLLIGLPLALLGLAQIKNRESSPLAMGEILLIFKESLPTCWHLYYEGENSQLEQLLPSYLSHLNLLVQQSTPYRRQLAGLTSQAYQLSSTIALQKEDFGTALTDSKLAVQYGRLAEDANILVASLIRQGILFWHLKRPLQTLQVHQEALQNSSQASPLLRGRVYSGLAETSAHLGHKSQAQRYIGLAQDTYPDDAEADLSFPYTHYGHFNLYLYEGLSYLHFREPKKAFQSFEKMDNFVAQNLVPRRVEALSRRATTFVTLGDLDQSCTNLETLITSAKSTHSALFLGEASAIYQQMQIKWKLESKVKKLEQLVQSIQG